MKIHATVRIKPEQPVKLILNTRTATGIIEFAADTLQRVGKLNDGDSVVLEITKQPKVRRQKEAWRGKERVMRPLGISGRSHT